MDTTPTSHVTSTHEAQLALETKLRERTELVTYHTNVYRSNNFIGFKAYHAQRMALNDEIRELRARLGIQRTRLPNGKGKKALHLLSAERLLTWEADSVQGCGDNTVKEGRQGEKKHGSKYV